MARDKGAAVAPPPDLHARAITLRVIRPKCWWRIHRVTVGPCVFSEDLGNRFSSPGLGVFYLADHPVTAFWEIFWDELATRAQPDRRISRAKLNELQVVSALAKQDVRVFDATDSKALKAVSAPTATFSGDYGTCQAWAAALAVHRQQPQGILYPSARHRGGACLALFANAVACAAFQFGKGLGVADHPEVVAGIADDGVDVLDD